MDGQTTTTGQNDSQPLALSADGEGFVQSLGSNAASGALGTVGDALPDLSSAAGANFASGALGQLGATLQPYLPYLIAGVALLLLIGRR